MHKSTASCFRNTLLLSCFGEVTSKSIDSLPWKPRQYIRRTFCSRKWTPISNSNMELVRNRKPSLDKGYGLEIEKFRVGNALTCKNLVYLDMLDSQVSNINWSACSSISGYRISFFAFDVCDAAAAIYQETLTWIFTEYEKWILWMRTGSIATSSNCRLILGGLTAK